jgi:hypothetical protein
MATFQLRLNLSLISLGINYTSPLGCANKFIIQQSNHLICSSLNIFEYELYHLLLKGLVDKFFIEDIFMQQLFFQSVQSILIGAYSKILQFLLW